MRWEGRGCRLADGIRALVWPIKGGWLAEVFSQVNSTIWWQDGYATEAAAKSAVAAWIGKTMAQFSNALRAGEPRVDEE